jgi:opacity protein-like surface antigen
VDQTAGSGSIGGQIGYRRATAKYLLFGLEVQGHSSRIQARDPSATFGAGQERVTTIRDPVSAALQVGIPGESVLVYLRGGWAYATLELEATNQATGGTALWEHHASGWTAGAGFEVLLRPRWSLGIQYDTYKLRAVDLSTVDSGGTARSALQFETRVQAVHIRTNYRF